MLDGMPVLPRRPAGSIQMHKPVPGQWQQSFIDLTRDWLAEGDNAIDGPCRLRRQASASGAFVKFYPGSSGSSRLVHASRHGWDSAIEFLLDHGAAVNAVDGKDNTAYGQLCPAARARRSSCSTVGLESRVATRWGTRRSTTRLESRARHPRLSRKVAAICASFS